MYMYAHLHKHTIMYACTGVSAVMHCSLQCVYGTKNFETVHNVT